MIIIALTQGKYAKIDEEDVPKIKNFKWYAHRHKYTWYAKAYIRGSGRRKCRKIYLHNLIIKCPKGITPDHINHNGLDCRKQNLRIATRAQQVMNRRFKKNIAGFKGVTIDKRRIKKWKAQIGFEGKVIFLGYFYSPKEAAKAYNKASLKYHGEFGMRNLILNH